MNRFLLLLAGAASLLLAAPAGDYRRVSSNSISACQNVDWLAWSSDGRWLAAVARGADDKTWLQLWREGTLQHRLQILPGIYQAAFSPDGQLLALADRSNAMNGISLFKPVDGAWTNVLETGWPISAMAFTPDGATLAASPIGPETGLWLWNTHNWRREKRPLDAKLGKYQQSLDFLPGGTLAISYADGNVGLWDFRTGRLKRSFSSRVGVPSGVMGGPVAITSDGRFLALAYTPVPPVPVYLPSSWWIRIWDLRTGVQAANLHPEREIRLLAFRPGTSQLALQLDGFAENVILIEGDPWRREQAVPWSGALETLAFSPEGDLAIAGPEGKNACRVELWRNR